MITVGCIPDDIVEFAPTVSSGICRLDCSDGILLSSPQNFYQVMQPMTWTVYLKMVALTLLMDADNIESNHPMAV